MDISVQRTKVKPLYDSYGSHEEYYKCPCGKDCIRRRVDGRLGMGSGSFYMVNPCVSVYTSVQLDKNEHVFHLQEGENK